MSAAPAPARAVTAPPPGAVRRGIGGGYLNLAVTWAVQLVIVPLLLHHLGRDGYGLFATLTSVVGYFGLLTFGSALTVPRYVADHAARGDAEALSAFVSTYFVAHLAIGAAGLVLGFAATPVVGAALEVPDSLRTSVAPAWQLVVAGWALGLTAGLLQSLLTGLGRVGLANLANSARTVANLGVAAAVVTTGGSLAGLLAGFAGANVLAGLALYVLLRRRHPEIAISLALARLDTLRATFRPAGYYFLMQVAALVVMGTDNIVIGVVRGVGAVAGYAVAFQLWTMTLAVLWAGVDALMPFFTRWDATNERDRLRESYLAATRWSFAGATVAAVLMAGFGAAVIRRWVGAELELDGRVVWVFAAMLLTATPIHTASLVLAALGKHRPAALGGAVEAALNLVLSIALVGPLGVLGVALGSLVSGLVTNAWVAPRAAARALEIPVSAYLRRAVAPGLIVGALVGAVVISAHAVAA